MGQLDKDFIEDRKYSDPLKWPTGVPYNMASDGSEGGYTNEGYYVPPTAMEEIVALRAAVDLLIKTCDKEGIEIEVE